MYKGSLFSASSPAFVICRLFDDSHFDSCEVISHCGFDLHFSDSFSCWASFHVPVSQLYVFFGKMSVQVFRPFLIGLFVFSLFNCRISLQILGTCPLPDLRFTDISLSLWLVFSLS